MFNPFDNCAIENELLNYTIKKLLKTINFIFGIK
jgi:hypothetical protein